MEKKMKALQAQLRAMGDERFYNACLSQLTKDHGHAPYLRELIRRWREVPKIQQVRRVPARQVAQWTRADRDEVSRLLRTVSALTARAEKLMPYAGKEGK